MSATTPNPLIVPFLERVAKAIWDAQQQPFSAPYQVAGALYEAGFLDVGVACGCGWIERQAAESPGGTPETPTA